MTTRIRRAAKAEADFLRLCKSVVTALERPEKEPGEGKSKAIDMIGQFVASRDRPVVKSRAGGGFDTPMYPDEELRSLLQLAPGEPIRRIDLTIALNVYWDYEKINVDDQHRRWAHLNTCERSLKDPKDKRFINVAADPLLARLLQLDTFVKDVEGGSKRMTVTEAVFNDKFKKSAVVEDGVMYVRRNAKRCRVEPTTDAKGVTMYTIVETDPRIMLCTVQQLISSHLSKTPIEQHAEAPRPELTRCEGKCKFEPFLKK